MKRRRGPWWLALPLGGLAVISACDKDDDATSVAATASAGESAGDDLKNDEDDPALTCAEVTCPSDHICVNPPATCDESGEVPVLRREDAFCRPIAAGAGIDVDGVHLRSLAMPECDYASPEIGVGVDGQAIATCPDYELPCE